MRKLLIATRSKEKFPEIVKILEGLPLVCLNLNETPNIPNDYEAEEPAATFEGNAIVKRRHSERRRVYSRSPTILDSRSTRSAAGPGSTARAMCSALTKIAL